jgi:hypothetical protein
MVSGKAARQHWAIICNVIGILELEIYTAAGSRAVALQSIEQLSEKYHVSTAAVSIQALGRIIGCVSPSSNDLHSQKKLKFSNYYSTMVHEGRLFSQAIGLISR